MACCRVTINWNEHWLVPIEKMAELDEWLEKNSWEFIKEPIVPFVPLYKASLDQSAKTSAPHNLCLSSSH